MEQRLPNWASLLAKMKQDWPAQQLALVDWAWQVPKLNGKKIRAVLQQRFWATSTLARTYSNLKGSFSWPTQTHIRQIIHRLKTRRLRQRKRLQHRNRSNKPPKRHIVAQNLPLVVRSLPLVVPGHRLTIRLRAR